MRAGQEAGSTAGMVARAVALGAAVVLGQAGEDVDLVLQLRPAAASVGDSSKSCPSPWGVQAGMITPLGTNMNAIRTGGGDRRGRAGGGRQSESRQRQGHSGAHSP